MIIPAFGFNLGQKSANVSSQKRLNLYCSVQTEQDKTVLALYRTPGLTLFSSHGASAFRGHWPFSNFLYVVQVDKLYRIANDGTVSSALGTLASSTGKVDMRDNGTQILIVDGTNGYTYTPGTSTFATITDSNFPDTATTCAYDHGVFSVENPTMPGQWVVSQSYDGNTWTPLQFATTSKPSLVRVFDTGSALFTFGENFTQFWNFTGALDFPFVPTVGADVAFGLKAKWSVAQVQNSVIFLAHNAQGHNQVIQLNGFQPQRISNEELENRIHELVNVSAATAFSYSLDGHQFYQLNFTEESWLYDMTSSIQAGVPVWSQVGSGSPVARHLADSHVDFFDRQIVSDYSTGNLYTLEQNVYTDNSATVMWKLISKHIFQDNRNIAIGRLWVDFETGVGIDDTEPFVTMRYSKDGGHTWSAELYESLGNTGKYLTRALWTRLGRSRDWLFELSGSDPVKVVIMNAGIMARVGSE